MMGLIYYDELSEFGPEQMKALQEYVSSRWKGMDEEKVLQMIALIEEYVVKGKGTWQDQLNRLRRLADRDQLRALEEFAMWFIDEE